MLQVERVSAAYGSISVLRDVSLSVGTGQFVSLIGANGAGKSTTLRTISGLLAPSGGSIKFEGQDITKARASTIVRSGITHCPEGRRVFPMMTVYENLLVGAHVLPTKAAVEGGLEMVFQFFPWMNERRRQLAGSLSGGEQQMLAISRALNHAAEIAVAGRALARPVAEARRSSGIDRGGAAQDRHRHSPGRAKCPARAHARRSCLCIGIRAVSFCRGPARISSKTSMCARPISAPTRRGGVRSRAG